MTFSDQFVVKLSTIP